MHALYASQNYCPLRISERRLPNARISIFKLKMHRQKLLLIFLFFAPYVTSTEENSYLSKVENSLEKFCDITNFVTEVLEEFNDKHLGSSEWGKLLGYEEIKPKISDIGNS